jgi:PAS domain S-box-containing protein
LISLNASLATRMNLESPTKNLSPIHDAKELLKDTEDLLQYGTWIWTQDTGTMEWSHGLYRLLGYEDGETGNLFRDDFLRHLPGADKDKFIDHINVAIKHQTPFQFTHSICTINGTYARVLTRGKIVTKDERTAVLGVTQDISRLPKVQNDPAQQRKLMNQYEMFLKFGTWQHDVASQEMQWSTGMYNLFGYDLVKNADLQITEAVYEKHIEPEDYLKGLALRKEIDANRLSEYFWQYRIITASGERKWMETYGHVERDKEGGITGTFGITRDITRLKLYEHSLESKIKELNRSNAELEEFAYVASHDMQEPLRKLITFSERLTLKYSDVLQDEGLLYVNRMAAATNNMRLLIDNLLDFSRVARTGEKFEMVDLNDMLQKTIADLEVSIEETQANITTETLPVIEAQLPQMRQLFVNVLSNALKFRTPNVPPQITIHCTRLPAREADKLNLERDHKYFKIDVKDNGIGFEPEYVQKIFQIFQRLHGKAEYPGSGIGLAICKKIVDYHNGIIYANGQLNEGATITIILPEKQ